MKCQRHILGVRWHDRICNTEIAQRIQLTPPTDLIVRRCNSPVSFFFFYFLAKSQQSEIGSLPYFHTWCGLNANLVCRSEMCWTLSLKIQDAKKSPKSAISVPYFHTWCGLIANLECMSEMCCTRLAENTGRKKVAKKRHLRTIAQLCRAISSQLRHVSTIGKKIVKH